MQNLVDFLQNPFQFRPDMLHLLHDLADGRAMRATVPRFSGWLVLIANAFRPGFTAVPAATPSPVA